MISVKDLCVSYGEFRLQNINLELNEGRCLAVLGPSGAGKTLLLETVMGARKPESGVVFLNGREITSLPPEKRKIAYIPQDFALFPHLSVRDNITFGLQERRARSGSQERLHKIAEMLGIVHLLSRKRIQTLSGGEKQRVAIARALIVEPRVLFLDEPFSSLDASAARETLLLLRRMRKELRPTIFLVSHDLTEVCYLADEVAIVIDGRIVERGMLHDVITKPKTVAGARFLNLNNIVNKEALEKHFTWPSRMPSTDCDFAAILPEDVVIACDSSSGGVEAAVVDVVFLRTHFMATLDLGGFTLEAHVPCDANLVRGQKLFVVVAPEKVLWLQE